MKIKGLKTAPALKLSLAMSAGIYVNFFMNPYALIVQASILIVVAIFITYRLGSRKAKDLLTISLFISLGQLMINGNTHYYFNEFHLANYENVPYLFCKVEDVNQKEKSTKAVIKVLKAIDLNLDFHPSRGKALIYFKDENNIQLKTGDLIILKNKFKTIEGPANPYEFDYKRYCLNKHITHQAFIKKEDLIHLLNHSNQVHKKLLQLRANCLSLIDQYFTSSSCKGLLKAMIIGDKSNLTADIKNSYSDSGAMHILAVSGLHVGIVTGIVIFLLKLFQLDRFKLTKILLTLIGTWTYVLFTGASPSAVRAAIMFSFLMLADFLNLQKSSLNGLGLAAIIILTLDPNALWDIGFQFSFLALLGILLYYPIINDFFHLESKLKKMLWSCLSLSISAQIFILPLSVYYFHKVQNLFWLSSLIAVPAATIILFAGFAFLFIASLVFTPGSLTQFFASALEYLVHLLNSVISTIANLPFAVINNIWMTQEALIAIMIAIIFFTVGLHLNSKKHLYFCLCCLSLASIFQLIDIYHTSNKNYLTVYHTSNEDYCELFVKGTAYAFPNNKAQSFEYQSQNNKIRARAHYTKEATPKNTLGPFHKIDNKLLLIYPDSRVFQYSTKCSIDIAVLSAKDSLDLIALSNSFKIKHIILDNSFNQYNDPFKERKPINSTRVHKNYINKAYFTAL